MTKSLNTTQMLLLVLKSIQMFQLLSYSLGTMSRPRSSVFAKRPMSGQPIHDPDEHPVTYRTQRAPLLPAPQSSRAPWLHTAAVTAVRFKQPSRAQTARLSGEQSLPMQVSLLHPLCDCCCACFMCCVCITCCCPAILSPAAS